MLTNPKLRSQVDALWDKFWTPLSLQEESTGVVAQFESLPLAAKRLGDFVRGRMGAPQSTRQALGRACRDLWRGCLRVCWRRRSVSPAPSAFGTSPREACDDGAVEFGGELVIEIFYEN
jgi:hypothetical protein